MKLLMLGSGSYKSSLSYLRLIALAKQLAHRGYDVHVVLPSADKYNNYVPDKKARVEDIDLVQPWQFTTRNDIINLLPYLFTATLASIRIRPQLIYLYKPTPITILGLIPKWLFRAPLILDLDDLGSEVMRQQGQPALQVKLVAFCERLSLRHADAVVVASTYLRDIVTKQYPNKPVLVLSNGVDPQVYKIAKDTPIRNAIYYFGAINRLSLISTFLRALPQTLAQVPDTKITILGDGKALDEAKALTVSLGVADHVTFAGWTEAEDLATYVQTGDVAVCVQPNIPTVRAASNLKIFQYMGLGSVVVVSDVGDYRSYVKDGQGDDQLGIVVPAENTDALAQAFITILKDEKGRSEIARKARVAAETEYAWSVLADKLNDFLLAQVPNRSMPGEKDV